MTETIFSKHFCHLPRIFKVKDMAKKKETAFVQCFAVSEPCLHEKGHTVYKVTQEVRTMSF